MHCHLERTGKKKQIKTICKGTKNKNGKYRLPKSRAMAGTGQKVSKAELGAIPQGPREQTGDWDVSTLPWVSHRSALREWAVAHQSRFCFIHLPKGTAGCGPPRPVPLRQPPTVRKPQGRQGRGATTNQTHLHSSPLGQVPPVQVMWRREAPPSTGCKLGELLHCLPPPKGKPQHPRTGSWPST